MARPRTVNRVAVYTALTFYTALAIFPIALVLVNSFKSRAAIFGSPLSLPGPGSFTLTVPLASLTTMTLSTTGVGTGVGVAVGVGVGETCGCGCATENVTAVGLPTLPRRELRLSC